MLINYKKLKIFSNIFIFGFGVSLIFKNIFIGNLILLILYLQIFNNVIKI